jgi:hypothetical protein
LLCSTTLLYTEHNGDGCSARYRRRRSLDAEIGKTSQLLTIQIDFGMRIQSIKAPCVVAVES